MKDEPFGRQPKPVKVLLTGEDIDVRYWINELAKRAEFKGDVVMREFNYFTIFPRAVND